MTFAFDGHYAMFDATPVDNQFIMDCVPMAKGDYVRVYLYGLMGCYHPEIDLDISRMSHDLDLPEEEIKKAYRYWERRGLVRRVSDTPPAWQYVHGREKSLAGSQPADPEYEAFAEALYGVFDNDRRLHGKEIQTCYEWVEDLKLPMEAVIMLLKHMARIKGKNFTIQSAGKVALEMAEEQVSTLEEAGISRSGKAYAGCCESWGRRACLPKRRRNSTGSGSGSGTLRRKRSRRPVRRRQRASPTWDIWTAF